MGTVKSRLPLRKKMSYNILAFFLCLSIFGISVEAHQGYEPFFVDDVDDVKFQTTGFLTRTPSTLSPFPMKMKKAIYTLRNFIQEGKRGRRFQEILEKLKYGHL